MKTEIKLVDYLASRRSIPAFQMGDARTSKAEVAEMLKLASRVPDHGQIGAVAFHCLSGRERRASAPN